VLTYGLLAITPPSPHVAMPATFGSSTHSYASVNAAQNQRDSAAGSTPNNVAKLPCTMSRLM
jgi:hypothetical protein